MVSDAKEVKSHVKSVTVLILVVMEYGLRLANLILADAEIEVCLNPCCNGIWSQTPLNFQHLFSAVTQRLNPCCNGIWSQTGK